MLVLNLTVLNATECVEEALGLWTGFFTKVVTLAGVEIIDI